MKHLLLALALVITLPSIVFAQGQHGRRAGANLTVLTGDIKMLEKPDLDRRHEKGLADRIRGQLSNLSLLLRLADAESGQPTRDYSANIAAISYALDSRQLSLAFPPLDELQEKFPFEVVGLLSSWRNPESRKLGRAIHEKYCAGCHDDPDLEVERPAYNLLAQGVAQPAEEFAARMVIGIRGDRMVGGDNPFTDAELSALIAFYRNPGN